MHPILPIDQLALFRTQIYQAQELLGTEYAFRYISYTNYYREDEEDEHQGILGEVDR